MKNKETSIRDYLGWERSNFRTESNLGRGRAWLLRVLFGLQRLGGLKKYGVTVERSFSLGSFEPKNSELHELFFTGEQSFYSNARLP